MKWVLMTAAKIVAGEDHLWAIERDVVSAPVNKWRRGRKPMVLKTGRFENIWP